jgi:hypothetical protein
MSIDKSTRLNFDKMLKESGSSDNTSEIRKLKHSDKIRDQVSLMMDIKKNYPRLGKNAKDRMIESKCMWLWKNYMNIYNKLKKDELNLDILNNFLVVLKQVESGVLDQHNASVKVGQILKELYVDSAIKIKERQEALDKKRKTKKPFKNLSWKDYKKTVKLKII